MRVAVAAFSERSVLLDETVGSENLTVDEMANFEFHASELFRPKSDRLVGWGQENGWHGVATPRDVLTDRPLLSRESVAEWLGSSRLGAGSHVVSNGGRTAYKRAGT
jgi:hypothetical protein